MLDYTLFRHKTRNRILLNLGGIANLTALPANTGPEAVLAFDTGPANMVVDAAIHQLTGSAYDCGGGMAAKGQILQPILDELLSNPYFAQSPPKSCGREQFGADFTSHFIACCQAENASNRDILTTATALTADSILEAYRRFVWPHLGQKAPLAKATDLIISGGGARNQTLLKRLRAHFEPLYVTVRTTDDLGLPAEAKEAAAFALLGWLTWHHLPGNIPSATGATRPVLLGRITPV